jgi:hypothetical protein
MLTTQSVEPLEGERLLAASIRRIASWWIPHATLPPADLQRAIDRAFVVSDTTGEHVELKRALTAYEEAAAAAVLALAPCAHVTSPVLVRGYLAGVLVCLRCRRERCVVEEREGVGQR